MSLHLQMIAKDTGKDFNEEILKVLENGGHIHKDTFRVTRFATGGGVDKMLYSILASQEL